MAQPPRGKKHRAIAYPTEAANRRRVFRHNLDVPEVARRRAARKDTKRWCRGKVGREHRYVPEPTEMVFSGGEYWVEVCAACGKVGRFLKRSTA